MSLLTAKSKVAPIKQLTMPRLELCAAVLGAKLLQAVTKALAKLDLTCEIFGWTDATIVLNWLSEVPRQWNVFVSNRVNKVQEVIPRARWFHVRTLENPADIGTRGLEPSQLQDCELWWQGPTWLKAELLVIPEQPPSVMGEPSERRKDAIIAFTATTDESGGQPGLIKVSNFSSFGKLARIMSFVFRLARAILYKDRTQNPSMDYVKAVKFLVRAEQQEHYSEELKLMSKGKALPVNHNLSQVYPFLDKEDNLLKVGGRLAYGEHLAESLRYQMLVPKQSKLALLIIRDVHERFYHAGAQTCVSEIRRRFWICGVKTMVRLCIHSCVTCFRFNSRPIQPLMADLPKERITPSPPFTHCGIDFAGPFAIKTTTNAQEKAYLSVFVCFSTKAVHLEVVPDLSGGACVRALRRFAARRGAPKHMYSDNGTNFMGTRREMAELQQVLDKSFGSYSMPNAAIDIGATWSTIPPGAPHWGGLWEAGVKSAKTHLKKVIGKHVLSYEELETIFCEVEAILNSRPLVEASSDPTDLTALTANMLVGGKKFDYLPLNTPSAIPANLPEQDMVHPQRRWKHIQSVVATFWKRWSREYLSTLQTRKKWRQERENLKEGDLVLVTSENYPPLQWPLGRVVRIYTGNDDVCRAATIRTAKGTFNRPVVKLRRIPINPERDEVTDQGAEGEVSSSIDHVTSQQDGQPISEPNGKVSSPIDHVTSQRDGQTIPETECDVSEPVDHTANPSDGQSIGENVQTTSLATPKRKRGRPRKKTTEVVVSTQQ